MRIARGVIFLTTRLELLTKELSVAQTQDFLVNANRVRAGQKAIISQLRSLVDQRLGVDDDLALTTEIGRQNFLHNAINTFAFATEIDRPAQDVGGAACFVGFRLSIVGDDQAHDQIVALGKTQGTQIQLPSVASVPRIATGLGAQALAAFADRDLFTVALCERDRELRIANAIVIGDLEIKWPLALSDFKLGQGLVGRGDLDLRRLIDNRIETVLALIGQRG